jgi:hypothetical protein
MYEYMRCVVSFNALTSDFVIHDLYYDTERSAPRYLHTAGKRQEHEG